MPDEFFENIKDRIRYNFGVYIIYTSTYTYYMSAYLSACIRPFSCEFFTRVPPSRPSSWRLISRLYTYIIIIYLYISSIPGTWYTQYDVYNA